MLFLDTNVILRFLMGATSPEVGAMKAQATCLFSHIGNGQIQATTSEVVLHEVCYVLTSSKQYARSASEAVFLLRSVLTMPNLEFTGDEKSTYLYALELWEQHPKLEFSDAVIAARCERAGHELATFDGHFAAIPSLTLWRPEPEPAAES